MQWSALRSLVTLGTNRTLWGRKPCVCLFCLQVSAWDGICCNEGLNLVIYLVQGVGNDLFWPPNVERHYTLKDLIGEVCWRISNGCRREAAAAQRIHLGLELSTLHHEL